MDSLELLHRPEPRAGTANVLAVASGKGGVGKTWLAITLAHALARRGRRVLLFDGDLGLANVDIQLGLMPGRDLGAVLAGRVGLADAAAHYAEGGFAILAGRSGCGQLAALSLPRLQRLIVEIREVAGEYDDVILDLGAGVDTAVRTLAGVANRCLVVTTGDPTALTDAYAFIKLGRSDGVADRVRVVVNTAASHADGQRTYGTLRKACETFLAFAPPLAGIVRQDPRVRQAIRAQVPLLTRFPNTAAAGDVEEVAARLAAGSATPAQ